MCVFVFLRRKLFEQGGEEDFFEIRKEIEEDRKPVLALMFIVTRLEAPLTLFNLCHTYTYTYTYTYIGTMTIYAREKW